MGGRLYAVEIGLGADASSASIVINMLDDLQ
jgi:hypothetical protein